MWRYTIHICRIHNIFRQKKNTFPSKINTKWPNIRYTVYFCLHTKATPTKNPYITITLHLGYIYYHLYLKLFTLMKMSRYCFLWWFTYMWHWVEAFFHFQSDRSHKSAFSNPTKIPLKSAFSEMISVPWPLTGNKMRHLRHLSSLTIKLLKIKRTNRSIQLLLITYYYEYNI